MTLLGKIWTLLQTNIKEQLQRKGYQMRRPSWRKSFLSRSNEHSLRHCRVTACTGCLSQSRIWITSFTWLDPTWHAATPHCSKLRMETMAISLTKKTTKHTKSWRKSIRSTSIQFYDAQRLDYLFSPGFWFYFQVAWNEWKLLSGLLCSKYSLLGFALRAYWIKAVK